MSHTPEPWTVSKVVGDYRPKNKVFLLGVAKSPPEEHPVLIAEIPRHRIGSADRIPVDCDEWQENAERIVACVNACKGIANPAAVPDLREACKAMRDRLTDLANQDDNCWRDWPGAYQVDAAIAKAEGKEPTRRPNE
jgi:hypothetical protein